MLNFVMDTVPTLYKARPVLVHAVQYKAGERNEYLDSLIADSEVGKREFYKTFMVIKTPDEDIRVKDGDWVIKSLEGRFSKMSNAEFEATYEEVYNDYATGITYRKADQWEYNCNTRTAFIADSNTEQKYQCTQCSKIISKNRCLEGIVGLTCPYCEGDVVKFE